MTLTLRQMAELPTPRVRESIEQALRAIAAWCGDAIHPPSPRFLSTGERHQCRTCSEHRLPVEPEQSRHRHHASERPFGQIKAVV